MVTASSVGDIEAFSGEWVRWCNEKPERSAGNTPPLMEPREKRAIRLAEWPRLENNAAERDKRGGKIGLPPIKRNENRWTAGGLFRPTPLSLFTARCP